MYVDANLLKIVLDFASFPLSLMIARMYIYIYICILTHIQIHIFLTYSEKIMKIRHTKHI